MELQPIDAAPLIIDFSRFFRNPVLLWRHEWDGHPLGMAENIKFNGYFWSFRPVFHLQTVQSIDVAKLYKRKMLKAYAGGEAEHDDAGQIKRFKLYEISLAP